MHLHTTAENLSSGRLQRSGDYRRFFGREDEWRRKQNMVATLAIDAALRGIHKYIFLQRGLANAFGDLFLLGKRFASGFVFHEFHGQKQADAANISNVWMDRQRRKLRSQVFAGG